MIIRKLYKFENAHVVRNCTSDRCKRSIHGHSYKVEVLLEAQFLDQGQMVYDFGLMKTTIRDMIDSFDHAITFWDQDIAEYQAACKNLSARWVQLPISPSAEQFCRLFFVLIDTLLNQTIMQNGEKGVALHSVIVHETDTGYAQGFREDAYNPHMGLISLEKIIFSDQVQQEWGDPLLYQKLLTKQPFHNPKPSIF